ncbi:hypothetical protein [Arenimonas caeni]|uniref:Uncharacterized protein n=1 Tax=Arenimonas caeni TaxID=2058085 RepID=A0A2P6M5J5_9GAMM|nr:hypothetical protein [Arenimonas caeni]PRH81283.1 hypothetical protein C6N40_13475 [Arenimonas caeni]
MGHTKVDSAKGPRSLSAIAPGALEAFRRPGQAHLSPLRFREFFGLGIGELERTLRAPLWLLRREPNDPVVQLRLLAFLQVHSALIDLGKDPITAGFHLRNTPIPAFQYQTLFEVVRDGRVADALGYLDSISSGFVG